MRWLLAVSGLLASACGGSNVGFSGVQDIGQFRAIVEEGGIPGPNTLDANGFFSEHLVTLPEPDCGQDLCLHGMLAIQQDWVYDRALMALQVALNTPLDPEDLDPRPRDIVCVIDVSRSMLDDDRLTHVVDGLHRLIDAMEPEDRLGIVAYETEVHLLSGLTAVTDPEGLHAAVDALVADGSTNLHDGLQAGLQMAADGADPDRQAQVILLSDGAPTRGVTDPQAIVYMASGYTMQGLRLSTVGVGTDASMDLLKRLAEQGGGVFYFVEDARAVGEVFVEELATVLVPLAYELILEVVEAPGYRLGEVIGTTGAMTGADGGMIVIPTLFLAARTDSSEGPRGGGGNLFFLLHPEGGADPGEPGEVARIRYSYRTDPDPAAARHAQTVTLTSPYAPDEPPDESWLSHEAMVKNAAMLGLFLGLREVTTHRPACAAWIAQRLEERTHSWLDRYEDPDITADLVLVAKLRANLLGVLASSRREVFVPEPPVFPGFCPSLMDDVCASVSPGVGSRAGPWKLAAFVLLLFAARLRWARRRVSSRVALPAAAIVVLLAGCAPLEPSVEVVGIRDAVAVTGGAYHDCVLDGQGDVWCWGSGLAELPDGRPVDAWGLFPYQVEIADVVQVSSATGRDCARTSDDAVRCWGKSPLGDDTLRSRIDPTRVVDLETGTDVSAGRSGGCAVDPQGEVWCWGVVPERIDGPGGVLAVSAGQGGHGCALTEEGTAWCWGNNNFYGQLGDGTEEAPEDPLRAVQVKDLNDAQQVIACVRHSCALTGDGRVLCWGGNQSGQGGYGSQESSPVPREVGSLEDTVAIACGDVHTCALSASGRVSCWGDNLSGQLGDGTRDDHGRPVRVHDIQDAVSLAAAGSHACAVLADGRVRCWGDDPYSRVLYHHDR